MPTPVSVRVTTTAGVEAVESVRLGDRFGDLQQGRHAVQRAVGPMLVVERFELGECVFQLVVRGEVAAYQPARACPGAPAAREPAPTGRQGREQTRVRVAQRGVAPLQPKPDEHRHRQNQQEQPRMCKLDHENAD